MLPISCNTHVICLVVFDNAQVNKLLSSVHYSNKHIFKMNMKFLFFLTLVSSDWGKLDQCHSLKEIIFWFVMKKSFKKKSSNILHWNEILNKTDNASSWNIFNIKKLVLFKLSPLIDKPYCSRGTSLCQMFSLRWNDISVVKY